jgi:hypothetical protein
MRLRSTVWPLTLTGVLIAIPISYEWVITHVGPFVLKVTLQSLGTIGLAQLVILAIMLPIVGITKISERWPVVGGVLTLATGVALILLLIAGMEPF